MATSRQLRKRKEVPVKHTPTILDEIVVRWEVDGSEMWWPATVMEVFDFDVPLNGCYGQGRLLYKKFKMYGSEEADVTFKFTSKMGHLVVQHYNGRKLQMSWSQHDAVKYRDAEIQPVVNTPSEANSTSVALPKSKRRSTSSSTRSNEVKSALKDDPLTT